MNYPKLKHALLCRILIYVIVIGGIFLPTIVACFVPFVPRYVKPLIFLASGIALAFYIVRTMGVMMALDLSLALEHCRSTARTRYSIPPACSVARMERRISHYGRKCAPTPYMPQPTNLRYRFKSSITVYTRGIEKVVAAYHTDLLDTDTYRSIFSSAKVNSKALIGLRKPMFLDKAQKKAPLNRVTVIVIFAQRVDAELRNRLYDVVCKQSGDDFEDSVLPCVIDIENQICVFNSMRLPYAEFACPVKNRGIRIVKQLIFGGRMPLSKNEHLLEPMPEINPEDSLWKFWKALHYEMIGQERELKRQFASMEDKAVVYREDELYVKWGERGICQQISLSPEKRQAKIESISMWFYPKVNPIAKKTIRQLEEYVTVYFSSRGYTVQFVDEDPTE